MADDGIELATAWVRLVPTMEGVQGQIANAFAPGAAEAGRAGDDAGKKWSGAMKAAMGAAAIAAGTVAAFKGLYEVGAVFDDVTDTIRVGTGAQGDALDGLVEVAKQVGTQVPAEFGAIGTTVADLNTRLGLSGDTLKTVATQYLEAGRILGEDVDIDATSAAFSAFKIQGDDVAGAMDSLFQVSQATGVGMNNLASGVGKAAPALSNLGFGFEDSIALMGSLDKAGLNSQQVLNSMSKGLVTLAKDGEEPASAFERVTGELQSFVDKGDTAAALDLAGQIFGTRGAAQFVGALQQGVVDMDDLMAATGATGDTIAGVGKETADAAEQWQVLKNKALTALEPLGSAVFSAMGEALASVNELFDGLPPFGEMFGPLLTAVEPLVSAFLDLWTSLSPMSLAFQVLEPLLPMLVAMLGQVSTIIGGALVQVLAAVMPLVGELVGAFGQLIAQVLPSLMPMISQLASLIGTVLLAVIPLIPPLMELVNAIFPILSTVLAALMPIIQGVVNAIGTLLVPIVNMLVDVMAGVIEFLTGVFTGDWERAWGGIVEIFTGLWEGLKDVGIGVINALIDIINGFTAGLNEVGNFVSDITGGAIDVEIGQLPHLADGATVLPRRGGTVAVLAEAGRAETVVDTGLMNRALEEGLGGPRSGGGNTFKVYAHEGMDAVTAGRAAYEYAAYQDDLAGTG